MGYRSPRRAIASALHWLWRRDVGLCFMRGFETTEPFMPVSPASSRAIPDHFSARSDPRPDPRQCWRVVYPLPEVLLLVLCATLSGMEDVVEIRLWGAERMDCLRRFLAFERGLPSHDTVNDVINALDPELFQSCFCMPPHPTSQAGFSLSAKRSRSSSPASP